MSFPKNITKENLLKAIDKIDNEGIPKDAQSVYYDVVFNNKLYPPKVVVSYANIYANGTELDRNSFSGGVNTPCFKLLEQFGFIIQEKKKSNELIQSETELLNILLMHNKEDLITYFEIFDQVVEKLKVEKTDSRLVFSCRDEKRITLIIGQRYIFDLRLNDDNKFGFISMNKTNYPVQEKFSGNVEAYYNRTNNKDSIFIEEIISGALNELNRTEKSGFLKNDNISLRTACFDIEYRESILNKLNSHEMKEQVLIYEVKSSANSNAIKLTSEDGKFFYWNDTAFRNLNIGDYVFVVNTHSNKVLFTKLDKINIPIINKDDSTSFNDLDKNYEVSGKYANFIRLEILNHIKTPDDWKWKSLGSSETTYINGPRINTDKAENRALNIEQLKKVFDNPVYNNVLDASLSNFKIVTKSYYDELLKFIEQSKTNDLKYAHYLKDYNDLTIKVSFGQGTPANIPWISFLRDGQTTSNGIYPVYLYFKEKNLLILAYGKSVTNIPVYNWPLSNPKTINQYFEENNLGAPYDYGDSFVFKAYLLNEIPTKEIVDKDLNEILSFYKSVKLSQATVIINTMDFNNIYRKEICAIKTKPFLLMAGISGTGKSRMVRTLAYKTCPANLQENNQPGNFKNISVKPNWHDSTELIGYVSRIPNKHYVVTDFIRFIIKAWKNLNTPFFLCLDEMNLAPVEQYFAEYLSKIESRQKNNNRVITDAIISKELFSEFFNDLEIRSDVDPELHNQFMNEGVGLPPNLVVIGTVNMDETTHSFSRKVLDRAMTFEKNLKSEDGLFDLAEQDENDWSFLNQMESSSFLSNEIKPSEILGRFNEKQLVVDRLNGINGVLKNTPFMVAYRTLDEALMYIYFNSICDNKPSDWFEKAFDEIIMMKVLPRIEGDEIKTAEVLGNLETQLASYNSTKSLEKCRLMIDRLKSGYTSYWN